ncbi:glycosyltransferase family 1 protein [Suillus paluster]|uniref:glycosyltransferase family 1 protein n=1 Tax=Suillus paluster TaxID=48578 RepID=UPI001B863726|nr:glycosyltransferase family 1 protein [Suillus paluster]KAG1756562.1 glycosyltransferase family 1 protein [Suillus paluster]
MLVFVTVGSTRFDALVEAAISEPVLSTLRDSGYNRLILQRGDSDIKSEEFDGESCTIQRHGVDIDIWKFKPSIQAECEQANLVISHAGSGTILDVLRLGKPLIVVPNPTLLDNHQEELASALDTLGHLKATSIQDLASTISSFEPRDLVLFPPFDGSKFSKLVDEEMGFI